MISCRKADDWAPVAQYLRRNLLANQCLVESLERNMPPVPREAWVAEADDGAAVGVMIIEKMAHGSCVDIRIEDPETLVPLLGVLDTDRTYSFAIPAAFRDQLLECVDEASDESETVSLIAHEVDLQPPEVVGELRVLSSDDRALCDEFPSSELGRNEPTLAQFVEWASDSPTPSVFGLVNEGQVVSYVSFGLVLDGLWEVGMIRTRRQWMRRGFGKAVLLFGSREMLRAGQTPLY